MANYKTGDKCPISGRYRQGETGSKVNSACLNTPLFTKIKIFKILAILTIFISLPALAGQNKINLSNQQIKRALIQQSISNYSGTSACLHQTDRAGKNCGERSAYKKAGEYDPLCYSKDVTPQRIEQYRNNMRM